jgi:hypothetical protein
LEPGTTKNDDGRVVYLTPELQLALMEQVDRVKVLERTHGRVVPFLFPNLAGPHVGKLRKDFKRARAIAIGKAGCPGMLRHDFRRTAVRNLVAAGVPERVAMNITGHKTRSVFDRYHVVSPADLKEAATRSRPHPRARRPPRSGRCWRWPREADDEPEEAAEAPGQPGASGPGAARAPGALPSAGGAPAGGGLRAARRRRWGRRSWPSERPSRTSVRPGLRSPEIPTANYSEEWRGRRDLNPRPLA